jgi:hypothetical protein
MRVGSLMELLEMFPKETEVLVQTCEGDLLSPLEKKNIWLTEAWIDERYKNLERPKLVITAFIKGLERLEYKNDRSGVLVKYEQAKVVESEVA